MAHQKDAQSLASSSVKLWPAHLCIFMPKVSFMHWIHLCTGQPLPFLGIMPSITILSKSLWCLICLLNVKTLEKSIVLYAKLDSRTKITHRSHLAEVAVPGLNTGASGKQKFGTDKLLETCVDKLNSKLQQQCHSQLFVMFTTHSINMNSKHWHSRQIFIYSSSLAKWCRSSCLSADLSVFLINSMKDI